jgi:putative tricarboxylic transport membrane protein
MRLHPALLGLIFIALAAAFFGYTFTFPALPGQRYGPALFPRVIATGIALCGLVLVVQGWRSGAPWVALDESLRRRRAMASFLITLGAIVFYLLAAPRLGFLPVAAVIVGGLAWWMGAKAWVAIVGGVVASAVMHWFFASIMRVPLPRGWFMQLVAGG